MFIQLINIKDNHPINIKGNLDEKWVADSVNKLDIGTIKTFDFSFDIEKKGEFIQIEGNLKGSALIECVRCLKEFIFNFDEKFRIFLYQEDGVMQGDGGEIELKYEDLDFALLKGDQLDLAEIIKEQLILIMPDYPLCEETCSIDNTECKTQCNCDKCDCAQSPFSELKSLKFKH